MFRTAPLSIIRSSSLYTQQWYIYGIQVCWQFASRIRTVLVPSWSCSQAVSRPVWHIPLLCVQWNTCRVLFQNKFEKLVHLVGFSKNFTYEFVLCTFQTNPQRGQYFCLSECCMLHFRWFCSTLHCCHGFLAYVLEHNLGMEKITETKFYYLCCLTGIADFIKPRHTHKKIKKFTRNIYRKPKERDQLKEGIMGKQI